MANWDVFHGDRGEVRRNLTVDDIRAAVRSGEIGRDDLVRPAGTSARWTKMDDLPELVAALAEPASNPSPGELGAAGDPPPAGYGAAIGDEFAINLDRPHNLGQDLHHEDMVDILDRDDLDDEEEEEFDPQSEDEAAAEFTFSRSGPQKIEELDLAAMVDVAFQMVLFFLVTGTTIIYKSLEVPKPQADKSEQTTQSSVPKLEDLQHDYILIEIDNDGVIRIDKEPAVIAPNALIAKLRELRDKTSRKAVLVTANFKTHHKNTVLAIDAANEIGLSLALARPVDTDSTSSSPSPSPPPAPPPAKK